MDAAQVYADARARVTALAREAGPDGLARPVAATPGWSGLDVLAHLVGVTADVPSGRVEGAGTDEWTARQVAERRGAGLDALLNEWQGAAASFDAVLKTPSGIASVLAADVVAHELDLRAALALGLGRAPDEELAVPVDFAVNVMLGPLDRRIRAAGLAALHLRADEQEWVLGDGEVGAACTATALELFRITTGRRSEAQVASLDWDGDPSPYLPVLSAFGPLRADDLDDSLADN